jgi:hypothetical protein
MPLNNFVQQYTVTATATALANNPVYTSVFLTAKSTNTGIVYVGFSSAVSSSNGYPLEKGTSVVLKPGNTDAIYIVGTASDVVSAIGS